MMQSLIQVGSILSPDAGAIATGWSISIAIHKIFILKIIIFIVLLYIIYKIWKRRKLKS